jgi:hypothetical protein
MGRLIAFLLGGLALALYAPPLFLSDANLGDYKHWCQERLGDEWYGKLFGQPETAATPGAPGSPEATAKRSATATVLPGVFAGLALVLLAVRGRDHGGYGPT